MQFPLATGAIEQLFHNLHMIEERIDVDPPANRASLADALEEMNTMLVQMEAMETELYQQSDALASAWEKVEWEREWARALFDAAPEAFIITDEQGGITQVNRAGARLLRVPEATLVGQLLARFINRDDLRKYLMMMTTLRQQDTAQELELGLQTGDQLLIWVAVAVSAIRIPGRASCSLLWIFNDVTDHRVAKESLADVNNQLEQLVLDRTAQLEATIDALKQQIAERQQTEQALRERTEELHTANQQLRQLSHQLGDIQETERRRLARELHDEAGQSLTALKITVALIGADLDVNSPLRSRLEEVQSVIDSTMEQIHLLALTLRPPALDTIGLDAALANFCQTFAERVGLQLIYMSVPLPKLPEAIAIGLYRVVQEALTNIARHARGSRVWISIWHDSQQVMLLIEDDGQGFDPHAVLERPSSNRMGLSGIRERLQLLGGELEIDSAPDHGTYLIARIPYQEQP